MRPRRILLAEDSLVNQTAIAGLLTKQGYEVIIAHNGQEAVDIVFSGPFDVVLMDVEMPVMDGLTAVRKIRQLEADSADHIPIIAVTSGVDSSRCLEAGMDAHLEKPVQPELLQETLTQALSGGRKSEQR
jgi:CheY-like chemotaxis protein